jgi:hypothetical protein
VASEGVRDATVSAADAARRELIFHRRKPYSLGAATSDEMVR